jgi:hypothetical protein
MASDLDVRFRLYNTWPGCGEIDIMEYKEVNLIKYMEHSLSSCFGGLEIPILRLS